MISPSGLVSLMVWFPVVLLFCFFTLKRTVKLTLNGPSFKDNDYLALIMEGAINHIHLLLTTQLDKIHGIT